MPPLLGGFNVGQVAGGEYGAGPFPDTENVSTVDESIWDRVREALGAARVGAPVRVIFNGGPHDFTMPTPVQDVQQVLQEHGLTGGGGWDPLGYVSSGLDYYTSSAYDVAAGAYGTVKEEALGYLDYMSNVPGEIGEAGGELFANLGAGLGSGVAAASQPLWDAPGDLLKNIPIWVPVLGAAFLLTRGK